MGFMSDFFGGFVDGIMNSDSASNGKASKHRIERLCCELDWTVDERDGKAIILHFTASDGEMRKVRISNGDKSFVGFYVHSDAILDVDRVPAEVLAYLLQRNLGDSGLGMWGINVDEDDDVTFHLSYIALGDGLDAAMLTTICKSMTSEVSHFDEKLQRAGLLD